MKQNYTRFECDRRACPNEIEIESGTGFPYDKGWCYIYNLEAKLNTNIPKENNMVLKEIQVKNKDKHFCSRECMLAHLKETLMIGLEKTKTKKGDK